MTLSAGDDTFDFELPTDIFSGGHYVPVRGVGVEVNRGGTRYKGFAGAASMTLGAPFFRGAASGTAVGMFFLDRALTSRLGVVSRNVFSDTQTSIHGLEWRPKDRLTLAAAGGFGASKPYAASSVEFEGESVSVNAAKILGRSTFRQIDPTSPASSETTGENVSVAVHPQSWWSVSGGRQNLIEGDDRLGTGRQVTVNRAGVTVNRLGVRVGADVFESRGPLLDNLGTSLSVGRRISTAVEMTVNYFRAGPRNGSHEDSVVASLQETVNPRLSLLQVVTRSGGQTSMNVGGQFLSNPLTVAVTYQNVYAPFRTGNPFVQAVGVDVRLRIWDIQLQAGTYTTPDGRLRYTVSGSRFLSLPERRQDQGAQDFVLRKYLIRGRVEDLDGQPVTGAAIQIGEELLFTDRDGQFFLRTKTRARTNLTVLPNQFIVP